LWKTFCFELTHIFIKFFKSNYRCSKTRWEKRSKRKVLVTKRGVFWVPIVPKKGDGWNYKLFVERRQAFWQLHPVQFLPTLFMSMFAIYWSNHNVSAGSKYIIIHIFCLIGTPYVHLSRRLKKSVREWCACTTLVWKDMQTISTLESSWCVFVAVLVNVLWKWRE